MAIEATTGWRWVWRELVANGFEVRLAEPVQTRALLGRRRSAKTDRLDARWLARLLAKEMLPESWIPPAQIQQLRDRTRLRKALAEDRRRWGQRLHAYLLHEGWPCSRSNLLRPPGLRWAAALQLSEHARLQVDSLLSVIAALQEQLDTVDAELRRFARADERCRALQSIYGIGPILACHLLAEIGEARRFRRAEQITRLAGLDPVVDESGETRRRGHLAKAGSPHLRWALVEAAVHAHRATAPDLALYRATRQRRDTTVARLTVARKIGKRAFHTLRELALAPLVSPVRILSGESEDQSPERALERRSPRRPVRVGPAARDELAVPAKQHLRLEREGRPSRPGK